MTSLVQPLIEKMYPILPEAGQTLTDVMRVGNPRVLKNLFAPAVRGLVMEVAKKGDGLAVPTQNIAHFSWSYERNRPELARLYTAAKNDQWDSDKVLPWQTSVDPEDTSKEILSDEMLPLVDVPAYLGLPRRQQLHQKYMLSSWILSQFLHGEQGALFAACQVTEAVQWMDGKLYGSTQVVDEGRHVEVFHRYLTEKLGKVYQINDNLYTLIDALMRDPRWDIKFLTMQIMIEGLALGAFGTMRAQSKEPLLRELLKYVITDEARHVHYGVVALRDCYAQMNEKERQEREDWAFELSVLMRNRFFAHEFYDEFYGHVMSRKAWNALVMKSRFLEFFRRSMFKRIVPNLKRIGLLSDRIRPHYAALGLLDFEAGKAAPDLQAVDLME